MHQVWTVSYGRITAIADESKKYVDLIEDSPTLGGSAWSIYHLQKSPLVISAKREGSRNIIRLKTGKEKVKLNCHSPIGIEEVKINDNIEIKYRGLGGSGIGMTGKKNATGVIKADVFGKAGGGNITACKLVLPKMERVIVGIDDTDNKEEGATWSLAHNIALKIQKNGLGIYISHSIVQLYSNVPFKTQNCASTSIGFATNKKEKLVEEAKKLLGKYTLSENTGMAVLKKFEITKEIAKFGIKAKKKMVHQDELEYLGLELHPISGERGLIGAAAAIAFHDKPDEGVRIER